MPALDSCINDLYEPGNIPGDPGQPPHVPAIVTNFFVDLAGSGSLRVGGQIPGAVENIAARFGGAASLSISGTVQSGSNDLDDLGISTLLWLDANDAGTFTFGTGVNVAQWNDKSGNANHVAQATSGNQPDYDTTNVINGLPVVTFDGTDDRLEKSSLSGWPANNGTAVTVLTVWRHTSSAGNRAFWDISTGAVTNTTGLFFHGNSFELLVRATGTSNPAQSATGVFAEDVPVQFACTVKSDNRQIFVNGTSVASNTTNNGTSAYTNLRVGSLFQDVFPMEGQLGEMVVFSGNNSTTRQTVEGYLAWKWGIQASLPGGHPYAGSAP